MQMRIKVGLPFRWPGGSQPVHTGKFANMYCSKTVSVGLLGVCSESHDSPGFCQWVWAVSGRRSVEGCAILRSLPVSAVTGCNPSHWRLGPFE